MCIELWFRRFIDEPALAGASAPSRYRTTT
jgi:hypothetical protein